MENWILGINHGLGIEDYRCTWTRSGCGVLICLDCLLFWDQVRSWLACLKCVGTPLLSSTMSFGVFRVPAIIM